MTMNIETIIRELEMQPHPEGGYYKETYRSVETLTTDDGRTRNLCTAIYYLMCDDNISHLHRIKSDEIWLFHQGDPVEMILIEGNRLRTVSLGNNLPTGERPQVVAPAGSWFGARIKGGKGHALVSCTVSPGFVFQDFELGKESDFAEMDCYREIKPMISSAGAM
ncbi:MAG: cupin domain-containing protein [Prevotellaceae bacterium]|jgi:predicted cupin superfamily sugar epimerase|nr:cupin domain-containing protein [Prevotellaceae bacterium]